MALKKFLILRSPRSGRLEGRAALIQPDNSGMYAPLDRGRPAGLAWTQHLVGGRKA